MRCSEILQSSPDSDSEISLKIGQYLMKLRRMEFRRTVFWATLHIVHSICVCATVCFVHASKMKMCKMARSFLIVRQFAWHEAEKMMTKVVAYYNCNR